MLPTKKFRTVVDSTPLVSIDLIVENECTRYLLGHRINRPAMGFWFVPGGRIFKNETLDEAFLRLTQAELGIALPRASGELIGVYEHLYADSVFGEDVNTHYVVLGYRLRGIRESLQLPPQQHDGYRWQTVEDILSSSDVHENTKAYFR